VRTASISAIHIHGGDVDLITVIPRPSIQPQPEIEGNPDARKPSSGCDA